MGDLCCLKSHILAVKSSRASADGELWHECVRKSARSVLRMLSYRRSFSTLRLARENPTCLEILFCRDNLRPQPVRRKISNFVPHFPWICAPRHQSCLWLAATNRRLVARSRTGMKVSFKFQIAVMCEALLQRRMRVSAWSSDKFKLLSVDVEVFPTELQLRLGFEDTAALRMLLMKATAVKFNRYEQWGSQIARA